MRISPRQDVPVYGPHTPVSIGPDFYLPYPAAKALLVSDEATAINRASAIRLKKLEAPKVRDASARMSAALVIAYAAIAVACKRDPRRKLVNSPIAQIVASWQPNHHAFVRSHHGKER
jgi:hypothetical protein